MYGAPPTNISPVAAAVNRADASRTNRFPGWSNESPGGHTPQQQVSPAPPPQQAMPHQPMVGLLAGHVMMPPQYTPMDSAAAAALAAAEKRPIVAKRFKTELCRTFEATGTCPYVNRCMFAHGLPELRTPDQNVADGLISEEALRQWRYAQHQRYTQQQQQQQLQQPQQPTMRHSASGSGVEHQQHQRTSDYTPSQQEAAGLGDPPLMSFVDPDEQGTGEPKPTWWRHEPYSLSDDQEANSSGKVHCWPASRSDEM